MKNTTSINRDLLFGFLQKITIIFTFVLLAANESFSQWTNGQSAVRIVGASDYTSSGSFYATGIAIDATRQKMYVSDMCDNTVKRYALTSGSLAASPVVEATFGTSSVSGGTSQTLLKSPSGLAVDNTGRLFIVDGGNNRIVYINSANTAASGVSFSGVLGQSGSYVTSTSGTTSSKFNFSLSSAPGSIFSCTPAVYAAGYIAITTANILFVSDPGNNRVLRFDAPTTTSTAAIAIGQANLTSSSSGTSQSTLNLPMGVAVNGTTLYVTDLNNNRVLRYNSATTISSGANASGLYGATSWTAIGTGGASATQLNLPIGLAVDGSGRLYINDSNNGRTVYINAASSKTGSGGTAVTFDGVIGQATLTAVANATAPSAATFWAGVTGIAVNTTNNKLYVGNSGYGRMLQYNSSSALPAVFINISAQKQDVLANFIFSVASENNVEKYIIETSSNGVDFVEQGIIPVNNTSVYPKQYQFSNQILPHSIYFRVKSVDFDNVVEYSSISKINSDDDNSWKIYPDPAIDEVNFDRINFTDDDIVDVKILDLSGKVILQQQFNTTNFKVNVETIPAGNYILNITETLHYNNNSKYFKLEIVR